MQQNYTNTCTVTLQKIIKWNIKFTDERMNLFVLNKRTCLIECVVALLFDLTSTFAVCVVDDIVYNMAFKDAQY